MAIVISIAAFLLVASVGMCYVKYRNHKADEIWQVQIEEVSFSLTSAVTILHYPFIIHQSHAIATYHPATI